MIAVYASMFEIYNLILREDIGNGLQKRSRTFFELAVSSPSKKQLTKCSSPMKFIFAFKLGGRVRLRLLDLELCRCVWTALKVCV